MRVQLRILAEHPAEAQDRQIVSIALPYNSPGPSERQLSHAEAETARRRFHVSPREFAVILLGKDGDPKLRAATPIPMSKLEETIDAMPMRQNELSARVIKDVKK